MKITCPKCSKPSKHNEAFLGPKGSILRCPLCSGFVKVFNRNRTDEIGPAMWVVRKKGSKVVQVDRLSTLQRWVLDGTVGRRDELLRSGHGWVRVEDVPELGGLLHLARLDEDSRRAEMWKMPTLNMGAGSPPPPAEGKADKKASGTDGTEDEDTVQIPGKVLEESIKLSEADEIITAEILLLDEADEVESEPDDAPVALVKKPGPKRPKPRLVPVAEPPQPRLEPVAESPQPRLEPVAEPPEPEKPMTPVLAIEGEIDESSWPDGKVREEEAALKGGGRRGKPVLQIMLVIVLALVAGAAYVHRERIVEWGRLIFPPDETGATGAPHGDMEPQPEETPAAVHGEALPATKEEPSQNETDPPEGGMIDEGPEAGKGVGPKGYEEHYKKALALQHADDCGRAVEFYRKAIEIDHRHSEAWTGIAECYEELGKGVNAVNSYKSALHYNSKYGPALLGLADLLKKQGKLEAALDYYTRYLETSPGGSRVASARKSVEEIKHALHGGGGEGKKDPIGIPENPYGP